MTPAERAVHLDGVLDVVALLTRLDLETFADEVIESAQERGMSDAQVVLFGQIVGVLAASKRALLGLAPHAAMQATAREEPGQA